MRDHGGTTDTHTVTVDGGHTIRKFPWLEEVAKGVVGEQVYGAAMRGD